MSTAETRPARGPTLAGGLGKVHVGLREDLEVSRHVFRGAVSYVVPTSTATMLVERAAVRWSDPDQRRAGAPRTVLPLRPERHGLAPQPASAGSCTIAWGVPGAGLATITRLDWDPRKGGSEEVMRRAINLLAGWPIARAPMPAA